jgi:hypothetical protein
MTAGDPPRFAEFNFAAPVDVDRQPTGRANADLMINLSQQAL